MSMFLATAFTRHFLSWIWVLIKSRESHFFAEICIPITRQAIELESYPNHPQIEQVFTLILYRSCLLRLGNSYTKTQVGRLR